MKEPVSGKFRVNVLLLLLLGGLLAGAPESRADEESQAVPTDVNAELSKEAAAAATPSKGEKGGEEEKVYATQEDLDALKDVLEEKITRGAKTKALVNLSGSGTIGYFSNAGKADSFGVSGAGLNVTGNLREDPVDEGNLSYYVGLYFGAPSPTALTSATQSGGGLQTNSTAVQSPVLTNVYLKWDLLSSKQGLEPLFTLSTILGQQLVPFGADNQANEDKIPTIKKAQYLGGFGISRDIGLVAQGGIGNRYDPASGISTPVLAYWLGAFNGTGANKADNNNDKDYVARVVYTPTAQYLSFFRDLNFGASYYHGRGAAADTTHEKERYGLEFQWLKKPFLVTAEGVFGSDEKKNGNQYKYVHSVGAVATLFWNPNTLPDFQPLIRYDFFDPNTDAGKDRTEIYTIGFNWFFYQTEPITRRTYEIKATERVIKLQVNWNLVKKQNSPDTANDVSAQVVFSF